MSITRVYLGNPLSRFGMQSIPAIFVGGSMATGGGGVAANFSRGTVSQQLIGGGMTTQRLPELKSSYQIGWNIRKPVDVDMLMSFFDGRQGGGPYCLIDPSQSNFLPPNVAGMGAVYGALPEWTPTAGTLTAAASTVAGPTGLLTGVGVWSGGSSGSVLYMGLNNIIDGTWLPPTVPGLSIRFGIYAQIQSGSASLAAAIMNGAGGAAANLTVSGGATALSGSWQELVITLDNAHAYASTDDYSLLRLTISSATSPVIRLAAASLIYDTATNAAAASPWVAGAGVPRCVIVGDAPSPVGRPGLRDFTMTLAEAA